MMMVFANYGNLIRDPFIIIMTNMNIMVYFDLSHFF